MTEIEPERIAFLTVEIEDGQEDAFFHGGNLPMVGDNVKMVCTRSVRNPETGLRCIEIQLMVDTFYKGDVEIKREED